MIRQSTLKLDINYNIKLVGIHASEWKHAVQEAGSSLTRPRDPHPRLNGENSLRVNGERSLRIPAEE